MSYKINKFDSTKKNFIVEYNHNRGLLIQDGAEVIDGIYTEFTYALLSNEIMYVEQIDHIIVDYDNVGNEIGTHTEIKTVSYPIVNPNYEIEQKLKERKRIDNLTCTKRVFALMLQEIGITYNQLKELIATNEQAQLEWDLCVELERKNPLLDIMASQLGITSEQLDALFRYANDEITIEEFRTLISQKFVYD